MWKKSLKKTQKLDKDGKPIVLDSTSKVSMDSSACRSCPRQNQRSCFHSQLVIRFESIILLKDALVTLRP